MKAYIKAYCRGCKRWVSDDLSDCGEGLRNDHEHPVYLYRVVGKEVPPGGIVSYITDLSPEAYLRDASRLDAELIVKALKRVAKENNWPFQIPERLLRMMATQVIQGIRQVAVEDERKARLKKPKAKKKLKLDEQAESIMPQDGT